MNNEINKINVFIHDNKYYFLDIKKKTVIKDFNLSDFLISLYEDGFENNTTDTSTNLSTNFKKINDVENYLIHNELHIGQKYNYDSLKEFVDALLSNSKDLYKTFGNELSNMEPINYSIVSNIKLEKDLSMPLEVYSFSSYKTFILFTIFKVLSLDIKFNKCKNCGKYFVPTTKSNEIYCTRTFRANKTCRDIGYENSIQSDEISKAYRNAYKTQNAKKQRNKFVHNIDEKFFNWAAEAKEMYKLCKDNKIALDEFNKWLKEHQDWIGK